MTKLENGRKKKL